MRYQIIAFAVSAVLVTSRAVPRSEDDRSLQSTPGEMGPGMWCFDDDHCKSSYYIGQPEATATDVMCADVKVPAKLTSGKDVLVGHCQVKSCISSWQPDEDKIKCLGANDYHGIACPADSRATDQGCQCKDGFVPDSPMAVLSGCKDPSQPAPADPNISLLQLNRDTGAGPLPQA